jgi:uncharacterized protein YtpQ (UPF0354 family)
MLTEFEFAEVYIKHMLYEDESLEIEHIGGLELRINASHRTFLDNAFKDYKRNPDDLAGILERYCSSALETIRLADADDDFVDPARIVPIVKDAAYPQEVTRSMIEAGAEPDKVMTMVWDSINEQLVALFAVDTERSIHYFDEDSIKHLDIARDELLERAVANLLDLLPDIQIHGDDGLYMVTAGGTYEASMLLVEGLWTKENFEVWGQIVVAAPTRDLLLVTGSEDKQNLAKLSAIAEEVVAESSYRLCADLFVRQDGSWLLFDG